MTKNFERFISEYNKLHDALRNRANREDDFFSLLKSLERDSIIARYKDELHLIRKLRNLLVHEKKTIQYDIAEPSEVVIDQMGFIRKQIIQPATAGDHFSRQVFSFNIDDSLERLLYFINQKHLYQFPIFDEDGLEGVLSHNGITNWLARYFSKDSIDLNKVTIKEIVADEDSYYHYEVIPTNTSLFDVEAMFSSNLFVGRSQYVILISDKDKIKKWEDLQGIITPWDLPELMGLLG